MRNYHGDGISFQQSNDVAVVDCVSEGNADLGLHPGSGSQRPVVRGCVARGNGTDGLFLCWRVRHGVFEDNRLEGNGRFGISIGHKDSDNLLRGNQVVRNGSNGVFFRDEAGGDVAAPQPAGGQRHRGQRPGAGHRRHPRPRRAVGPGLRGQRDPRHARGPERTQTVGILVEGRVGPVELGANRIEAGTAVDDRRREAAEPGSPR